MERTTDASRSGKAKHEVHPQIDITNAAGIIDTLHDARGFGFLIFATESGRRIRIFFHYKDTDGTAFELGDEVSFDLGSDSQGRPRAYRVTFLSSGSETRTSYSVNPEVRHDDDK